MTREEHADYVRWLKSLPRRKDHFRMPCPECSATRSNPKDPSFSVHITREGGWAKCFHCDFAIAWNEDEMWKREQKQQERERQKQQKDASQHHNTSQHHDAASQHHNTSQRKPHIPLQPPVHYVCPVINKNKQIMNGKMMEYMVGRRGIPMDVLTRMKIEERMEFLPQTGKARTFSGWTASWSRTSMTRRKSSWPWIPTSAEWSCAMNWCAAWAWTAARWWPGEKAARMPTSIC